MATFREILAQTAAEITSSIITDVGDTYQEVLLQHASTTAPEAVSGQEWITTHDPEPEAPMNDRQLQKLIDRQPEQQPKPEAPRPSVTHSYPVFPEDMAF